MLNIREDIRQKWHKGFPRKKKNVKEIVIHGTAGGGSAKGLLSWMFRSGRKGYKRGIALFHYIVDYDGEIYEIINPDNWVYHSSSGRHDKTTIGIELMNKKTDNEGSYTSEQYASLDWLILHLMNNYPIKNIVSHSYNIEKYSRAYKNCPGSKFKWGNVEALLVDNGYEYDYIDSHFFNIEEI